MAHGGGQFLETVKTFISCDLVLIIIIIIIIIIFSECTEAIIIPLETILPEECAFIIGFSCTVRTKLKSLLALYLI